MSSEGSHSKSANHCHCHCANSNCHSNCNTNQHLVSDGDSGGEFTATTVTNDFVQTTTGNTVTTSAAHNGAATSSTDDELSSLLNQIAVCSAKIIEQQQQSSTGGAPSTGASCSSNNSNSTSSSSGCCCSSASLLDGGSASGGVLSGGKCPNSNSLGGIAGRGHFGSHHNVWNPHPHHHQSPPHSVQLKKSNMRHSSTMLAASGNCSCESCSKPQQNPIISSLKSDAHLEKLVMSGNGHHPFAKQHSSQMYSPNHHQSPIMNRSSQAHHHWSQSSFEDEYHQLGGAGHHHQLHSPPSYAMKRSAAMGALNEASTSSATPFTLGEHMTGFMFAPSAMDLLSAASCNSVIVPPPSSNPSTNLHHQLGHYRHHSSGVLRGGSGGVPLSAFTANDHHPQQQQQPFYHLQNLTGEPEMTANAFIFDPSVDVESFLNEVEKELDDNCYASAPPFMARNGQTMTDQRALPTGSTHHGHLDGSAGYLLSPHRYFSKSQHLNQIGAENQHLQHSSPGHHQHYQHALSSTPTLVNLGATQQQQLSKGAVYSSLNSGSSRAHQKMAPNNGYSPLAHHENSPAGNHSSSMMAGGNWRLSQRASTVDLANNSGGSNTITNSPSTITPGTAGGTFSGTTSHFPFPSTASMPLTNSAASELGRAGVGNPNSTCNTGNGSTGNLVGSVTETQRYKRLIVPSASRDLLDNFRAQVSHRVATETDSQLRQVEQWFQEQVQASMGARQTSVAAADSTSEAPSFAHGSSSHPHHLQQQHILQTADRRRFSADNINKSNSQSNTNNSDLIYFG